MVRGGSTFEFDTLIIHLIFKKIIYDVKESFHARNGFFLCNKIQLE
ncbi:hypothetical protein F3D3_1241 [Fusibacter sp. 3D3]|nr:hypothetical protein F3D3_1241 [Fusibacter sp. 3D3]